MAGLDSYTVLLLHNEGAIVDASYSKHIVTASNFSVSSTQSKFGGTSAYTASSNGYLSVPDSADWTFGSGDFTVDFWYMTTSSGVEHRYVQHYQDANNFWYLRKRNTGHIDFAFVDSGSVVVNVSTSSALSWNNNQWYHIALVRNGANAYVFRDGVSQALNNSSPFGTLTLPDIGAAINFCGNNALSIMGFADEFRVSKGIARWVANFDVAVDPYTSEWTDNIVNKDGNLLSVWKLNEASGTRYDSVGSLDLTDNNTVLGVIGKENRGADFESSSSEYLSNSNGFSQNKTKISISCWIKIESNTGTVQRVLEDQTDTGGRSRCAISVSSSLTLNVGMRDTSAGSFISASSVSSFSLGQWYHILAVIDTVADKIYAWVDGAEWINSSVSMGNFYNAVSFYGTRLGCYQDVSPSQYFDGIIDEVYIWDDALTQTYAVDLWNGGYGNFYEPIRWADNLQAKEDSLIHVWRMDESSGTRYDSVGSLDLTDNNTVTTQSGAVLNFNRGADFESSSSEYLSNSNGFSQNKTKISISCWIKLESSGIQQRIISDDTDYTPSSATRCALLVNTDNTLLVFQRDTQSSAGHTASSTNTFSTGQWYHILAVIDTVADKIYAWVNGVEWINSSVTMGTFYNAASNDGTRIGVYDETAGGSAQFFDGVIDEVYVWEDALTQTHATDLYNGGTGLFRDIIEQFYEFMLGMSRDFLRYTGERVENLKRNFEQYNINTLGISKNNYESNTLDFEAGRNFYQYNFRDDIFEYNLKNFTGLNKELDRTYYRYEKLRKNLEREIYTYNNNIESFKRGVIKLHECPMIFERKWDKYSINELIIKRNIFKNNYFDLKNERDWKRIFGYCDKNLKRNMYQWTEFEKDLVRNYYTAKENVALQSFEREIKKYSIKNDQPFLIFDKNNFTVYGCDVLIDDVWKGFINLESGEDTLPNIPLSDGEHVIEFRMSRWFWSQSKSTKRYYVTVYSGELQPPVVIPDVVNLNSFVQNAITTISFEADWNENYGDPNFTGIGVWLSATSPVNISGTPTYTIGYNPKKQTYKYSFVQSSAQYVAVAGYKDADRSANYEEIYLYYDTIDPNSPENQFVEET